MTAGGTMLGLCNISPMHEAPRPLATARGQQSASIFKMDGSRLEPSPSPPFRGEREGPVAREPSAHGLDPWGWEGEVGHTAHRTVGPPHPALSSRSAGGEGKMSVVRGKFRMNVSPIPTSAAN
jgi:hypothetical protein